jgi:hypothetical protein
MEIGTIGLDLAKSVFQLPAINEAGEMKYRRSLQSKLRNRRLTGRIRWSCTNADPDKR